MKHSFVATAIGAVVLASSAWAQTETPTETQATRSITERKGFVFGVGVGLGIGHRTGYDCDNCWGESTASTGIRLVPPPELQVGFMASPKVAILFSVYTGVYFPPNDEDMRTFDILAPTIQYFLNDKTWVKAGVGLGMDSETFLEYVDELNIDTGVGVVVAAGTALVQKKNYTLDLEGRILFASIGRDVSTFDYRQGYLSSSVSQKFTSFEVALTFTHW